MAKGQGYTRLTVLNRPDLNNTPAIIQVGGKLLEDVLENSGGVKSLIPAEASAENKLADKAYVDTNISTASATFRGTSAKNLTEQQFLTWADALTHDLNDYVFWDTVDLAGATEYKRYKWDGTQWSYEWSIKETDISGKADKEVTPTIITPSVDGTIANLTTEEIESLRIGDIIKNTDSTKVKYAIVASIKNSNPKEIIAVYADDTTVNNYKWTKNGNNPWSYSIDNVAFSNLERKTFIATSIPQSGMMLGYLYNLGLIQTDTTFTLASMTSTYAEAFMWTFETGDTVPTLAFPNVIWTGASKTEEVDGVKMPVIEPNKHYEVNILGGYGTIISADIPQAANNE